jgi:hypothetical protein
MRTTAGIVLAVVLAVALATLMRFASDHVGPTAPAPEEASTGPMLPLELMKKSGKDLPDKTVREPF